MLKDFCQKISEIISNHSSKKYLLAVSGGVDSMVMMELFSQAHLYFGVAHCNFQLRNNDSFLDQKLVEETSLILKKEFHLEKFRTQEIASQNGESIQITARKLRYDWFSNLIDEYEYDYVVTAHHANDNLETAIYKLAKGTGAKGVRGILPLQKRTLRPLLNFTKKDLEKFAEINNIQWREDGSNKSLKYRRNFIRHQIIPLLEELNPQAVPNFSKSAERLRAAEQALNEKITFLKNKLIAKDKKGCFHLKKVDFKSHYINTPLLFELLNEFKFSYYTCASICKNIDTLSGTVYHSTSDFQLLNDRENLIIYKSKSKANNNQIPIRKGENTIGDQTLTISVLPNDETFKFEKKSNIIYLDGNILGSTFEVRNWKVGDKINPFGMKGRQKVSDILINQKVPVSLKKNQLVLLFKGQIIWVVGRRASNSYKITNNSIIRIHVKEHI